uniref:N/A n=1 Tax=Ganoderma boninense TaxID=34458 RepID=A0A5K1K5R5_9APHY|nr:N/A [Ganoderma boninense]
MEANADRQFATDASIAEDNQSDEEHAARERDTEFWYADGNVILAADNVEFRVYKGILADHSPVFKDMFSLPQPDPGASESDACPVVLLTDSPSDLRYILRVCIPKPDTNPFAAVTKGPSFESVSASICLGHKYDMTELVAHGFSYLKTYFPTTYKAREQCPNYRPPAFSAEHAIAVVNLARAFNEPALLPCALLACTTLLEPRTLILGFERTDGVWEKLSEDDLVRCMNARGMLFATSVSGAIRVFKSKPSSACSRYTQCQAELQKMLEGLDGVVKRFADLHDPTQSRLKLYKNIGRRVCVACHEMLKERNTKEQRDAWVALPGLLGVEVEGWDTQ